MNLPMANFELLDGAESKATVHNINNTAKCYIFSMNIIKLPHVLLFDPNKHTISVYLHNLSKL